MPRWTETTGALALALALIAAPASGQDFGLGTPRSASDWLSGKAPAPAPSSAWRPGDPRPADARAPRQGPPAATRPAPAPTRIRTPGRAPSAAAGAKAPSGVATSAAVPAVTVTRLPDANPDTRGALPADRAALPRDLWGPASAEQLSAAIAAAQPRLGATRALLGRMLTAQLAPPSGSAAGDAGGLFLARVDRLLALGQLPEAEALLQAAGAGDGARFARRFDVALYRGDAGAVCAAIAERPGLAPDLATRVYCLAQAGDWAAAALTLHGARDGGLIAPQTVALLERFLDDSSADLTDPLPDPRKVTPLEFRLFEAIGQPLPTGELPLAFAWADLAGDAGWKARIEAAERLARAGAAAPQMLGAAYLDQRPAASGPMWDRAGAFQRLDAALTAGDAAALATQLPAAERLFADAGLLLPLAAAIGPRLAALPLTGAAAESAAHLRLLAGEPVADAAALPAADRALAALAAGAAPPGPASGPAPAGPAPAGDVFAPGSPAAAYLDALTAAPAAAAPPQGRGLALLAAIADVDAGLDGDVARAAAGLRHMAELGQGADARRAAIELILADHLGGPRR